MTAGAQQVATVFFTNLLISVIRTVLLPLLYYSFKPQGEYLWSLYCKRSGVKKLYEIKLALFSALMNKDLDSAIEQTHRIMDVAKNDLGFYGA